MMVAAAAVSLVVVGAGCSDETSGEAADHSGVVSARLVTSSKPVDVADGADPSEVSIGVSRALFASAPVVVVAAGGDKPGARRGASQASRLGVPLLLVGHQSASGPGHVVAEISRLDPGRVLAMSASVARELKDHVHVRVTTDAAQLTGVTPADPVSPVAVLIRKGKATGHGPAATAVVASARAAGATVIPVTGADLRADPRVIKALARLRPGRVVAVGRGFGPPHRLAQRVAVAKTGVQLPGGGQVLFPTHRLVALYGHPSTSDLGVLGDQDLTASIARAKTMAARYQKLSSVPVVPTFEIIATVAAGAPGPDGRYSTESTIASLRPWVTAAGKAGLYVVLDLQPGRANLLDQAKRYAPLLKLPYVGLALDPEWKLTAGQVPLQQIGSVDATQINTVSAWLSDLTRKNTLPSKLLVLHQFQLHMIGDEQDLDLGHDNVQVLIHMDGQGSQPNKDATWQAVTQAAPKGIPFGWKNFYDEDHPMLTPAQTMSKKPQPMMISYQ